LNEEFDEGTLRVMYDTSFIEQSNARPYELFARFKDGRREILDVTLSKKFGKVFNLENLLRLDLELPESLDFKVIKDEFLKLSNRDVIEEPESKDKSTSLE
jgi:hypothetical protein